MPAENLLTQLHDIHSPTAISSWPLAPGWYILLILIIVIIPLGIFLQLRRRRHQRYRQKILTLVSTLQQQKNISQLNVLLKRIALHRYGKNIGTLQGPAWLTFLDKTSGAKTVAFQSELGALLLRATYQVNLTSQDQAQLPELSQLITQWVQHNV